MTSPKIKTIVEEITSGKGERDLSTDRDVETHAIASALLDMGFEELGSGINATAYARRGDAYVIKVARHVDASHALAHGILATKTENPHLPKVYSLHTLRRGYVVRMERLTGLRESKLEFDDMLQMVRSNLSKIMAYDEPRKADRKPLDDDFAWTEDLRNALVDYYRMIELWCDDDDHMNDCHAGNIMLRGKVPVLTDIVHTSC